MIIPCPWTGLFSGPLPRRTSSLYTKNSQKSTDIFSVILITRRQPVPVALPRLSELTVIDNKLAMLVHKCLNDHAPEYLIDQCRLAGGRHSGTGSAGRQMLEVTRCNTSFDDRSFTAAAPQVCAGLYFVWGHICWTVWSHTAAPLTANWRPLNELIIIFYPVSRDAEGGLKIGKIHKKLGMSSNPCSHSRENCHASEQR